MNAEQAFYKNVEKEIISALTAEVITTPKPGLVDIDNSGAHKDMDYRTFIASIEAIGPYFTQFAQKGAYLGKIDNSTLEQLRPLGLQCERAMLNATKGVNTHKGAIFSLGILASSIGYCYKKLDYISVENICKISGHIGEAALNDFRVKNDSELITNGYYIYHKYGIKGARGEAASGFISVRKYALPIMQKLFKINKFEPNDIYIQVLLNLMYHVIDTNVIARKGLKVAQFVKDTAKEVLDLGGAISSRGKKRLVELDKEFIKLNISPGGCADLLAIAIFLYDIEKLNQKGEI